MSGAIVWFTGLPSSGKTTLATHVRARLAAAGMHGVLLDGDAVRVALGALRYTARDRDAFYRALAELAALVARQGLIALVAATAPRRAHRDAARSLGPPFVEVWVDTPLDECMRRDAKGLYAAARTGEITSLPGLQVPYEVPLAPSVIARDGTDTTAAERIEAFVRTYTSAVHHAA